MKPQVIFIGPTKSGTTWIDRYLRMRDDVTLPQLTKETFFFDKRYDRGIAWYETHFQPSATDKVCVEIAPSLFAKPEAMARVAADLPDAKVICTVRNPIDRAVSHYFHYVKAGAPDIGFRAMCQRFPDVVEAGLYHKHLIRWESVLGAGRLQVLPYDGMRSAPEEFCAKLCSAIGIDYAPPSPELLNASVNEASVPRNRFLALAVRKGTAFARSSGAHRFVNFLRDTPIRRLAQGRAPAPGHRDRIRAEALSCSDLFGADFELFAQQYQVPRV